MIEADFMFAVEVPADFAVVNYSEKKGSMVWACFPQKVKVI